MKDNTYGPNENSAMWQSPTDPPFARKPGRTKIQLLAGVIVSGQRAGLVAGDILDVDQGTAADLIGHGQARPFGDAAERTHPKPSATKRVRLVRGVVVRGFPQARPGDVLTLVNDDALYLIGQKFAEEVQDSGWRKLARVVGL